MFKYRLYPSKTQRRTLEEQLELCCRTNNLLLLHCRSTYKNVGRIPTQYDLNNFLIKLKQENPELQNVHSQVLQNISKRIRDAHYGFFTRRRMGLKAGLPRLKKRQRYKSLTYPQSGFEIKGDGLNLSKIGRVKVRLHRPIEGSIKTLTVKRMPSGKWFAIFSCVVEAESREKPVEDVGIDVGLKHFAVLSDGVHTQNPQHYRREERRLGRLQRSLSRKERGSSNQEKARVRVAQLHEKIQNRRNDFLHKASRMIADKYRTVYVEDLKIENMVKNHHLAKSISDAGWGQFVRMLAYKEEDSGGRVVYVDPRGTTQSCSRCGEKVEKSLSDRIHACPYCGLVLDRDLNAALNILARGREIRRGPPESRPEEIQTPTSPIRVKQVGSMNQEASLHGGR